MAQLNLVTLGGLSLEGKYSSRLSPQLLLLLCYLKLEGLAPRMELANLFWPNSFNDYTQKGERKDLRNLGSALATLRRELELDPENPADLAKLPCDALELLASLEARAPRKTLSLLSKGIFLKNIEHKPRLSLGSDLSEWLHSKRQLFKRKATQALLELAEKAMQDGDALSVKKYAQQLFEINQDSLEPAFLSRLYQLLLFSGSPLATDIRKAFEDCLDNALEDARLSAESLELFLTLALQESPQLASARIAANLSPKKAALCLEELIRENLIGAKQEVLAADVADYYLDQHPSERLRLLSQLREASPPHEALSVYRQIYHYTKSFGGAGYWAKARAAYQHMATVLIQQEDFQEVERLLEELRQAEDAAQQTPDAKLRFLHAYALERLRQPVKGLNVLENVEESLEVLAIKSALLLRAKNYAAAKKAARYVFETASASDSNSWARAIATGSLGQIAYFESNLAQADIYYDLSIAAWQLNQVTSRELGTLMNRTIILSQLGKTAEAKLFYETIISKSHAFPLLRIRSLVNLGYLFMQQSSWLEASQQFQDALNILRQQNLAERDKLLTIEVLNNLGYSLWQSGDKLEAHKQLNTCMQLASESGEKLMYAAALGNLGAMHHDLGKLDTAPTIFNELGNQREYDSYLPLLKESLQHLKQEASPGSDSSFQRFLLSKHQLDLTIYPNEKQNVSKTN